MNVFRRSRRAEQDDGSAADAARQVADATRELEQAFRRIQPTLDRLPGLVATPTTAEDPR